MSEDLQCLGPFAQSLLLLPMPTPFVTLWMTAFCCRGWTDVIHWRVARGGHT